MPIVIMTITITFLVLITWTYRSLGEMETKKKILWIIVELAIILIATYITYSISRNEVVYPNEESKTYIQNVLVLLFSGINGLFVMPFVSRRVETAYQEDMTIDKLIKRIMLGIAILVVLLFLECGYMASTQSGILRVMMAK